MLDANAAALQEVPHLDHHDRRPLRRARHAPSTIWHWANGERLRRGRYLVSLGISADRLRTVSYGKEFPFDAGHDEAAYVKNRRAHFVVTAK